MTPTPKTLYVHDDLSEEVRAAHGSASEAARAAAALLALVTRDTARVRILTLDEQLTALARGEHTPFTVAIGIGRAGERVARQVHARTGWFPRIERVDLTREESGDGYTLSTLGSASLEVQLRTVTDAASIAVVDDTIFSGLTMMAVLKALDPGARARARVLCLRAIRDSLDDVATMCPASAGFIAGGRLLEDVSFINASGLVRRGAIRRTGQAPLAFYERPEWMRAWFLQDADEITARCAALARLLEDSA
jgi:hypothetical protein